MKLSILVPVYNGVRFLEPIFRCLVSQKVESSEIIFVDDCSNDASLEMLRHLKGCYVRSQGNSSLNVRIVALRCNVGVSEARQRALEVATGEYIIFVDPDDMVDEGMYVELLNKADETCADFVWEDYYETNDCGHNRRVSCKIDGAQTGENLIVAILRGRLHGATWNKLIRRSFIEKCGARFLSGRVCLCEDVDFLCQVLMAHPVCAYHDGCHYHYVNIADSATHRLKKSSFESLWRVERHLKSVLDDSLQDDLERWGRGNRMGCLFCEDVDDAFFYEYAGSVKSLKGLPMSESVKLLYWIGAHGHRKLALRLFTLLMKIRTTVIG